MISGVVGTIKEIGFNWIEIDIPERGRFRYGFTDDEVGTGNDAAHFFRKEQKVFVSEQGEFFLAVDFWHTDLGLKVIPISDFNVDTAEAVIGE